MHPPRTLLEALRGGGSGRTEIFIGPNMQRVSAGTARGGDGMGGGGVGGLGSLGMLLRGIGVPGGFGGGMAGFGGPNVGNVGDYAFGDLSSLLQQLMAADPNRVRFVSSVLQWQRFEMGCPERSIR